MSTQLGKPSRIPLSTKPSSTLPTPTHTSWPYIDGKIGLTAIKAFHFQNNGEKLNPKEAKESTKDPFTPVMKGKVATHLKEEYIFGYNYTHGREIKASWNTSLEC